MLDCQGHSDRLAPHPSPADLDRCVYDQQLPVLCMQQQGAHSGCMQQLGDSCELRCFCALAAETHTFSSCTAAGRSWGAAEACLDSSLDSLLPRPRRALHVHKPELCTLRMHVTLHSGCTCSSCTAAGRSWGAAEACTDSSLASVLPRPCRCLALWAAVCASRRRSCPDSTPADA